MPLYIRISLIVLLFFAVFSFAAVEPWSALVLQTAVFSLLAFYLFGNKTFELSPLIKVLLLFFAAVIVLGTAQCLSERTVLDAHVKYPFTFSSLYTSTELIYFLFCAAAALLAALVFNGYEKIKVLLAAFTVCGSLVVIVANIFPSDEYVALFRYLNSAAPSFGPFINRNNAGVFLGFCFFCTLAYTAARHFEYFGTGRKNFVYEQLTLYAVCALFIYGIISTRSRGAMLFLVLTLAAYAFVFTAIFVKNKYKKIITFTVLFLLFASVFTAIALNIDAINKFSLRSSGFSDKMRMEMYTNSLTMLKEYPVFGVGIGAFPAGLSAYGKNMRNIERVHNDWLEFVLGTGIAGAIFALFFIFSAFFIFIKTLVKTESYRKRALLLGLGAALFYMAAASFVDFHLHIPANAFAFFIIFGAISSKSFALNSSEASINIAVKILIAALFALSLIFTARQSAAWRNFFMGASLSLDKKIEYYEKGLPYYKSASNGVKLAVAYHNAFLIEKNSETKKEYAEKFNNICNDYLKRYPADINMLRIKYQMRVTQAKLEQKAPS